MFKKKIITQTAMETSISSTDAQGARVPAMMQVATPSKKQPTKEPESRDEDVIYVGDGSMFPDKDKKVRVVDFGKWHETTYGVYPKYIKPKDVGVETGFVFSGFVDGSSNYIPSPNMPLDLTPQKQQNRKVTSTASPANFPDDHNNDNAFEDESNDENDSGNGNRSQEMLNMDFIKAIEVAAGSPIPSPTKLIAEARGSIKRTLDGDPIVRTPGQGTYKKRILAMQCYVCQEMCPSREDLKNHQRDVHQMRKFSCHVCKATYDRTNDLIEHKAAAHHVGLLGFVEPGQPNIKCPDCESTFDRYDKLRAHFDSLHVHGQFQCAVGECTEVRETFSSLRSHQSYHHRRKPQAKVSVIPNVSVIQTGSPGFMIGSPMAPKKRKVIHQTTDVALLAKKQADTLAAVQGFTLPPIVEQAKSVQPPLIVNDGASSSKKVKPPPQKALSQPVGGVDLSDQAYWYHLYSQNVSTSGADGRYSFAAVSPIPQRASASLPRGPLALTTKTPVASTSKASTPMSSTPKKPGRPSKQPATPSSKNNKVHYCTWPNDAATLERGELANGCTYSAANKQQVVHHVRAEHFKLPKSLKSQKEMGIVDDRVAADYIRTDEAAAGGTASTSKATSTATSSSAIKYYEK